MANHSAEPSPSQSPSSSSNAPKYGTRVPNRIFVGGITSSTTETELHALFSNYGNVRATKIISDRAGVSKGYGFVTFETEEEASKIQEEADSIMLKERKLNIAPAIRKQQAFSTYSRTYESTTAASSNPILYHNGVPYTYNNGMAYFAAPETGSYPQYGAQQTAAYSMLYPTVYVQPQHAPQQYQYQIQASTAQHAWTANDWRWASNVGYGQNPSPVVTPQYVYAPSVAATGPTISNMGDQTGGPNNQLSVPNYQGNQPQQPSYNPNAAGGAGDHADLQTIENNLAESSKHQYASSEKNGKEEQRRADNGMNAGYTPNGGNNYQSTAPAILYAPIQTMAPSSVPMNTSTNGPRGAERRGGGHGGKRNEPQEKYPGSGTRNTRKAIGNDKNPNGNMATALVQQPAPNTVNYPGHTARTFPNAMHYAYQYQNPQLFQQYHYVPGYLQYPPPPPPPPPHCNTRFRGHNSIQSRHPAPRMYLGAGNGGNVNGGSNTPMSSRNGQGGPLTPPNTPMSPGGIAASDPAIIGSMCAIQTLSLN